MDLSLDQPEGYLFVRRVDAHSVTLVDRVVDDSFLLTPTQVSEHWPVDAATRLDSSHVEALLALQPEVVILGTGQRQVFPPAAFMAGFLRRGIGVEVMDNAAAARTYNLLAAEDRHVVAGFILTAT
ncbi:MAG TPA: Mth938-like domain-containing protein [Rhodanobacter sp.]|nr:Mth938-like domain-containing protein [Rhodanobacter sp.]